MTDLRMYLVVREDLFDFDEPELLRKFFGKMLGQAGHGFVHSFAVAPDTTRREYDYDPAHPKIVVRIKNLDALQKVERLCLQHGVPHHVQTDLGLTMFEQGTTTCLGIGPVTKEVAERDLKLKRLRLL